MLSALIITLLKAKRKVTKWIDENRKDCKNWQSKKSKTKALTQSRTTDLVITNDVL